MPTVVLMIFADIIDIFQSECSLYLQGKHWRPVRLKSMACKLKKKIVGLSVQTVAIEYFSTMSLCAGTYSFKSKREINLYPVIKIIIADCWIAQCLKRQNAIYVRVSILVRKLRELRTSVNIRHWSACLLQSEYIKFKRFIYTNSKWQTFRFLSSFVSEYFSQGQRLFEKLLQLTSQNIEIKLVSDVTAASKVLEALKLKGKAKVDATLPRTFCDNTVNFASNNTSFLSH